MLAYGASYPRSGKLLLTKALISHAKNKVIDEVSEEFYLWERAQFPKEHDYSREVVFHEGSKYIVQIRNPIRSLVSNFLVSQGQLKLGQKVDSTMVELLRWVEESEAGASQWKFFFDKWVIKENSNTYLLKYEDLILDFERAICPVLDFVGIVPNNRIIKEMSFLVVPRQSLEKIEWIDLEPLKEIEEQFLTRMEHVDIPRFDDEQSC